MELSFDKYEGLGNDFIVVEVGHPDALTPAQAIRLCDRHFGLGADGVLLVSPSTVLEARARMIVLNADGSRPEMCGNGLRCVALHLARRDPAGAVAFQIETDAGLRHCDVRADGALGIVTTGMGRGVEQGQTHDPAGGGDAFSRISMGNPHAVCFRQPVSSEELDQLGPRVSAQFAEGSNVEIATVENPALIRVDVWERGVGRTLACGTGAAATVVAAARAGLSPFDRPVTVRLPGGPLEITVSRELEVTLRGPARWVFSGQTSL